MRKNLKTPFKVSGSVFTPPTRLDPFRWRRLRIGLLGGSFNPPHAGHVHISRIAMRWLKLDAIWWVVTPKSPHKDSSIYATSFSERLAASRGLLKHPRMVVSDIEAQLNAGHTYSLVSKLKQRFPTTKFIWIGGLELAGNFHRWNRYKDLLGLIPFAFLARPPLSNQIKGSKLKHLSAKIARSVFLSRPMGKSAGNFAARKTVWIQGSQLMDISSTAIRNRKD